MKGTRVNFGGVLTDSHVHRVSVTDKGEIVLTVHTRYGNSNSVEYTMGAGSASLLCDTLRAAMDRSEKISAIYTELTRLESERLEQVMEGLR